MRQRKCIDAGIYELPNGRFWVSIMAQLKRRTGTVDTYEQAKKLARDFRNGRSFVPEIHAYVPWTVQNGADAYDAKLYAQKQRKGKTPSLTDYTWHFRQIVDALGADTRLDDLTPARISGFYDDMLHKRGYSASTVNQIGSLVHQMQKHAVQRGHMQSKPLKMERVKQSEGRIYYLTDDLERQCINWMRGNASYEEYALFIFFLDTGARHTEGRTIEWSDLDLTTGRITFWGTNTKTGKSRSVRMSDRLKEILSVLRRNSNHTAVFPNVSADGFYNTWGRLRMAMGLSNEPQFVIHSLRHTCATKLVAAGVDLVTVQNWMGHADVNTTMRYAHFMPERMSLAVEALNGRAQATQTTLQ